ncbi:bifunctional pyr operon transcriptional regulator/uracil phosphoribosyltransferase PyrR [bacterium]|nr:bifunctional pyr operon transcriptional regulator/uracil phosphoribosyltransferase PyrR [bacterium]
MKRKKLLVSKEIMNAGEMDKIINRMVHEIIEKVSSRQNVAIVGIRTRGVYLAQRIIERIEKIEKVTLAKGEIDIALYRDDFFKSLAAPAVGPSELLFNPEEYHIILVDDVLYTGRTVRAAIDALMDYGRPRSIMLAVLVDRGYRELPIQADFVGKTIETKQDEAVAVYFNNIDEEDRVVIGQKDKTRSH